MQSLQTGKVNKMYENQPKAILLCGISAGFFVDFFIGTCYIECYIEEIKEYKNERTE